MNTNLEEQILSSQNMMMQTMLQMQQNIMNMQ